MYNDGQSGPFYRKFADTVYVENRLKNYYRGTKLVKYNIRITSMINNVADGARIRIALIVKSNNPI